MADDIKTLAQAALAATTLTGVYTVGAGIQAAVSSVVVTNRGATDTTFRLAVAVAGAADDPKQYLMYDAALPAHESWVSPPLTLDATDKLRAYAGNGNVTVQVFGLEIGAAGGGGGGGSSSGISPRLGTFVAPPLVAAWTQSNAGAATFEDVAEGIHILAPADAGPNLRILYRAVPTPPYLITACLQVTAKGVDFAGCGVGWMDNAGLIIGAQLEWQTNAFRFNLHKYNSASAFNSSYTGGIWPDPYVWVQLEDDNTNRIVRLSTDGRYFTPLHSVGRTDFLTATRVICYANSQNSADAHLVLLSWEEA